MELKCNSILGAETETVDTSPETNQKETSGACYSDLILMWIIPKSNSHLLLSLSLDYEKHKRPRDT